MGYYGITFNTNNLAGNRFINCFLSGAVEIPGTLLCFMLVRRIGGRITYIVMMSLATIFLITSPLIQTCKYSIYYLAINAVIGRYL